MCHHCTCQNAALLLFSHSATSGYECLQSRRTDDPSNPDRSQSFTLNARPGPGQMSQADLPPPVKHIVQDPALQAMAAEAASTVAEAVRYHYEPAEPAVLLILLIVTASGWLLLTSLECPSLLISQTLAHM